jgi:hypothetical protein
MYQKETSIRMDGMVPYRSEKCTTKRHKTLKEAYLIYEENMDKRTVEIKNQMHDKSSENNAV